MKNGNNLLKKNVDLPRIKAFGSSLITLCEEMAEIFPGRRGLIEQIKYALLTRHHVMMFGLFGTGKTDLVNTFFSQILNAQKSSFALSKFSTEAHVFGVPSVKVMREEGHLEYNTTDPGTIFQSEFVELDEFLDANAPLLRSMLGILNERVWKRGRNFAECKLHTALASTNKDPVKEAARDDQLDAVIDRFLFQCRVDYLDDQDSRLKMYEKYLQGKTPSTTIDYAEIAYASGVVLSANQITEPVIIETYDNIIQEFAKGSKRTISDRRKCKLLQVVEANALLYGRFEVHPEDILAVKWGLCYGDDSDSHTKFDNIAKPHIEEAKEKLAQDIDKLQVGYLEKVLSDLQNLQNEQVDDGNYLTLTRRANKLQEELEKIKPQLDSTRLMQKNVSDKLTRYKEQLTRYTEEVK